MRHHVTSKLHAQKTLRKGVVKHPSKRQFIDCAFEDRKNVIGKGESESVLRF